MDSTRIAQMIREGLPGAEVEVTSEDNVHFAAVVTHPSFADLSRLQQHRAVYDTLGEAMGGEIHALTLTTRAPDPAG